MENDYLVNKALRVNHKIAAAFGAGTATGAGIATGIPKIKERQKNKSIERKSREQWADDIKNNRFAAPHPHDEYKQKLINRFVENHGKKEAKRVGLINHESARAWLQQNKGPYAKEQPKHFKNGNNPFFPTVLPPYEGGKGQADHWHHKTRAWEKANGYN